MAGLLASRSYLLPTIGGSALLAVILHRWWSFVTKMPGLRQRLWGAAAVLLAVIHLPVAAASWFAWSEIYSYLFRRNDRFVSAMELDPERITEERVILLTSPNIFTAFYPPFQRIAQHQPLPKSWWVLSLARCDHRLHRRGPDTLEVELVDGQMMTTPFENLYRDGDHPLHADDTIELTGLRVTVVSVADRGPTRISFQFDRPLDDPSLRFIAWRDGRMGRVEIPPVGDSVLLSWQGANLR